MLFCIISETKSASQPNAYMYVFATLKKKENLCFLNPKFKAVCHLLLLNRPVWVRIGRKPRDMFSILHSRESLLSRVIGETSLGIIVRKKAVVSRSCSFDEAVLTCTTIYVLSKN